MDFIDVNQPMEAIEVWQDWYRKHQTVAQMNEPLVTKDSRERLHDTSNTSETLLNTDQKTKWLEKAKEHFADTLAEYQYELSGKDFYKAFYQAAYENMHTVEKEYNRAKELVDMLRYHQPNQD